MCESASAFLDRDPLRMATADHRVSVRKDGKTRRGFSRQRDAGMPYDKLLGSGSLANERERPSGEDSEAYAMTRYAMDPVRDSVRCL